MKSLKTTKNDRFEKIYIKLYINEKSFIIILIKLSNESTKIGQHKFINPIIV